MAYGGLHVGGGGGTADRVLYNNEKSGISAQNVQDALDAAFGAVLPVLTVQITTGSAVTVTGDSDWSASGTSQDGTFTTILPRLGTYTVNAELESETTEGSIEVTSLGEHYTLKLAYFSATLTVNTGVEGAVVTAVSGANRYSANAEAGGSATLTIKRSGNYAVSATYSGVTSSSQNVDVTNNGETYSTEVTFITLEITSPEGSSLSITKDENNYTGTSTGKDTFYLPSTGTWKVTATKDEERAEENVVVSEYKAYKIELAYVRVFGVMWNYGSTSTACTRLKKSDDPNGVVNVDITTEPKPAVGTASGSSPFDSYAPWSGMEEYNIISNAVSHKKGADGFSRSGYDTVVYIPEFYYKITDDNAGKKRYFYVADKPKAGFEKHPGSGTYVGRYNTISGYYSKSGSAPLVSMKRSEARTGSKNKGSKWSQYDYKSWCAVWLLYLVEFADWNSQKTIGRGYVDSNSAAAQTGGTDSMNYHTGRAAGTDGKTQVQYRHIEDPWGNVFEWIDGINFNDRKAYICTDPSKYADDTESNYTATGLTLPSSGWIKSIGFSSTTPWVFVPTENGGSDTTYIPDYVNSNAGWYVLYVGGYWGNASGAGLLYFNGNLSSGYSYSSIGARLLYHP